MRGCSAMRRLQASPGTRRWTRRRRHRRERHRARPDSVGIYVSGQLLTEDYYVFNKLAKGLLGTNNIDTNSRLCMSSAVAGYKATLGADAPPACYEDIDHAGCLFIAGSNAAWAHPILFRRIEDAKARGPT
jgi:assimilatory nitrate reductase catalytic subunit